MTGYVAVRPVPRSASQGRGLPSTPLALPNAARQKSCRERCRNGDARIRYTTPQDRQPDRQGLLVQGKVGAAGLPSMESLIRTADMGRPKPLARALASVLVTSGRMTQTGPGHNGLPGPGQGPPALRGDGKPTIAPRQAGSGTRQNRERSSDSFATHRRNSFHINGIRQFWPSRQASMLKGALG